VIPFGTSTSLEGQINAPFGGIPLDLSHMNRILTVHPEDLELRGRGPASRARRSTIICAIGACSSPSTQAPMPAAAWPRPGPPARFRYLAQEHGAGVEVMVAIKKALDPLNILNPGKIFGLP